MNKQYSDLMSFLKKDAAAHAPIVHTTDKNALVNCAAIAGNVTASVYKDNTIVVFKGQEGKSIVVHTHTCDSMAEAMLYRNTNSAAWKATFAS